MRAKIASLVFLGLVVSGSIAARADDQQPGWLLYDPTTIQWRPAENLPPGAMVAVLEGDPSKEGLFTMRIRMPNGFQVPPHSHSRQERVTVISGNLNLGMGNVFDANATKLLPAGTYSSMPPGMNHFAWMSGDTVLQLTTMGPWTITYVDPKDDPRNKAK